MENSAAKCCLLDMMWFTKIIVTIFFWILPAKKNQANQVSNTDEGVALEDIPFIVELLAIQSPCTQMDGPTSKHIWTELTRLTGIYL